MEHCNFALFTSVFEVPVIEKRSRGVMNNYEAAPSTGNSYCMVFMSTQSHE